jgi:hypothetical protein
MRIKAKFRLHAVVLSPRGQDAYEIFNSGTGKTANVPLRGVIPELSGNTLRCGSNVFAVSDESLDVARNWVRSFRPRFPLQVPQSPIGGVDAQDVAVTPESPRFCSQCGTNLHVADRFCGSCGFKLLLTSKSALSSDDLTEARMHETKDRLDTFGHPPEPSSSSSLGTKNIKIALGIAVLVIAVAVYFLVMRESEALSWLKSIYPKGSEGYRFGCELDPSSAAALDWSPEMNFSLNDLENAWQKYC